MKALSLDNPWTKASLWGAVGSACMLIVFVLPFESDWIKELLMMASFSFSLMIVMLTVKASSSRRAFLVTFLSSLITWMCMFVLPHLVFVLTQEEEYHLDTWLVMFPQMLTLGIIVCAPLAWLILQIKKHNQLRADQQRQVIG